MARERFNIVQLKEETFKLTLASLKDAAGNDIDLTGHTLDFVIRNGDAILWEESFESPSMPVTITASVAEVATWPNGNHKYVLRQTGPDGSVRVLSYGSVTVLDVDGDD